MTRLHMALAVAAAALVAVALPMAPLAAQAPPAQAPLAAFEVASVKRNNSGTGMMTIGMQPGGRMTFVNVTPRQLIIRAFQLQPFQVIGGPEWISNDRFDVIAKAEGDATPEQLNLMLRQLLADRFKLVVHNETRELPVYYLVSAREDRRPGPELKPAAVDCGPSGRGRPGGPPPAAGPGGPPTANRPGGPGARAGGPGGGCQMMIGPGRLQLGGQPLSQFASLLSNQVGRPVIDRAGLTGNFDITLTWLPDGRGAPIGPLPPGVPELPPIDPNAPSLFTAVQEQLGLKLESGRGPVEVIVIDSVQPPTED